MQETVRQSERAEYGDEVDHAASPSFNRYALQEAQLAARQRRRPYRHVVAALLMLTAVLVNFVGPWPTLLSAVEEGRSVVWILTIPILSWPALLIGAILCLARRKFMLVVLLGILGLFAGVPYAVSSGVAGAALIVVFLSEDEFES